MSKLGFDLILLGAPAAGKDTQALKLLEKYQFKAVESGKHWRKMASKKNAQGALLRKTYSKGQAAPVKFMKDFLSAQLKNIPANTDLLFIGNPRLKPEAQLLTKLLKAKNRDYLVVSIELPQAEIKKRSLLRMRDEQDWKYVDNRIKMYKFQVSKTLDYFKSLNKLRVVKGNQSVPLVSKDILKIIHDYNRSKSNTRP